MDSGTNVISSTEKRLKLGKGVDVLALSYQGTKVLTKGSGNQISQNTIAELSYADNEEFLQTLKWN